MKAGLYIRVSTDKQAKEGDSLAEQEKTLTNYCNYRNIEIINLYREEGKSAKNTNRPQFQKMLKDCQLAKIDTVIVKKVDRLSRSLMDFEKTMKLFEDQNINLISLQENFDTSTAIGRAVIRIILTFAQLEREQTSERTIDVMQYRAEQGIWTGGMPPLGYSNTKADGLVPIEEESKMIPVVFQKYLELASYKKVTHYLNQSGFRPKTYRKSKIDNITFIATGVARILKNPVYIGKILHRGTIYQGKHKPLITENIFNKAQEIMKQNYRRNTSIKAIGTHNFILEKILKCGYCGSSMTPRHSNPRGIKYFYYECTKVNHNGKEACKTKALPAPSIESLVLRRVLALKKDTALLQSILDNNHGSFEKEIDKLESEKALLNVRCIEATNKAKAIVDKLLTVAELSHSQILYDEVNRLDEEKHLLAQRVQDISDRILQLRNRSFNTDNIKGMFVHFTNVYSKLNKPDKRLLMKILMKDITYKEDYLIINYYTDLDISNTSIPMVGLGVAGSRRPLLGVVHNTQKESFADPFRIMTSVVRNGKKIFNFETQNKILKCC